ncbi:hypothetical protein D3C76_1436230 [compost metagenome]
MAFEVHGHHGVPVGLGHAGEHAIATDAGVVHQHVQVAEGLDGLAHDVAGGGVAGDVAVVGDGFTALGADLGDYGFGGGQVDVVDQHPGAFGGEGQGIGPAQPAAGASDDDGAVLADWHVEFSG